MQHRVRVAIIFGGRSAEHEVSLQSARNILEAIDRDKYEPLLVSIDKDGIWRLCGESDYLLHADDPGRIQLNPSGPRVTLLPWNEGSGQLVRLDGGASEKVDAAFPVLHGPMGEDGTIQGLMRLAELPFAGPGVLGSAAAMDKDIAKKLFESAGLPVARSLVVHGDVSAEEVFSELGQPVFVKPANLGSSVGIHKVHSEDELYTALQDAFRYDSKVLIEEFITGRELECSVLGNESPIASVPGEIIPQRDFYSYEAKYLDENGALLEVPAQIDTSVSNQLRKLAVQAFQVLSCEGMARVDFFLNEKRGLVINEVNTIPGFTRISMYPRLWQASGVSYPDLIDRLIQLALERASRESGLSTSYST